MKYVLFVLGFISIVLLSCSFPSKGLVRKSKQLSREIGWLSDSIKAEFRYQANSKKVSEINSTAVRSYLQKMRMTDVTLQYAVPDSNETALKFIGSDPKWYDSTLSFGRVHDYGDSTVYEYIVYDQSFNPKKNKKSQWNLIQLYWFNDSVRLERHARYLVVVH